jgi:hypothetical protein
LREFDQRARQSAGAKTSCETPDPAGILANFGWPGKDLLTCMKNQGNRGTCHIFRLHLRYGGADRPDTGIHVNLSEQDFQENEKLLGTRAFPRRRERL